MPHRPGMRPLEEQVREALDAGITMLQLREKYLSEEDFLREALSIRKLTERYHVPLIINEQLYVAINSGADGIHIGQSDLPAREVRCQAGTGQDSRRNRQNRCPGPGSRKSRSRLSRFPALYFQVQPKQMPSRCPVRL